MGDEREDKKENEVYIMSDMLNRIHICMNKYVKWNTSVAEWNGIKIKCWLRRREAQ